jgi:hypothetical protein
MFIFIIFSFFSTFASQNVERIIIHMPGSLDGGFSFLNPDIPFLKNRKRYSVSLNPEKKFYSSCISKTTLIYTNNLPFNAMDLGGPACVAFYKEMTLDAHAQYPNAELILAGASQGSVGPFGALAEFAEESHAVVSKIKKVLIEAALGSTHETINFHVEKIPLLKILPYFSKKIAPLLAEYIPRFAPGFAAYDAFAPQMYYYIDAMKKNSEKLNHIKFYIMHDLYDDIIPYECAENVNSLLPKGQAYYQQTLNRTHLPAYYHQSKIIKFLTGENLIQEELQETKPPIINTRPSKTPLQRFYIRRIRDACVLATLFISYQSSKYLIGSIVKLLKNIY